MAYRYSVVSLFVFSLVFVASAQNSANTGTSTDVFATLPESQRANIRDRLLTMIELEKSGDWASVYDRFYDHSKDVTKEAFVTQRQHFHFRLLAFAPTNVAYISPTESVIVGCNQFTPPLVGHKGGIVARIYARLIDGEWRFTAPPVIVDREDNGSVKSCDVVSK